ncbi:hypothetical protein FB446DRAFT_790802 [Lentinula raphanica]|nr:hypothetical protein FB446DRAFT_790802 [Lentinula raphanica]
MHFHTLLLHLVSVSAYLCAAASIPHGPSRAVVSRRASAEVKNTKPETVVSKNEEYREWFKQLEVISPSSLSIPVYTSMLTARIASGALDPIQLRNSSNILRRIQSAIFLGDRTFFCVGDLTDKLPKVTVFSDKGSNNEGILLLSSEYTVERDGKKETRPAGSVIAKLIPRRAKAIAACEVHALQRLGLLIEAGGFGPERVVILMDRQPGKLLTEHEAWKNAPIDQKRAILQDLEERVYEQNYGWIRNDSDPDNVLVEIIKDERTQTIRLGKVVIVDLGWPSIWPVISGGFDEEAFDAANLVPEALAFLVEDYHRGIGQGSKVFPGHKRGLVELTDDRATPLNIVDCAQISVHSS